ncbi:protease pro-enzyme activation domain-containing protein [Silvibacterium sp.]|uniref:protease pro-enzyme activation domain-containing protein n=1 Tax=Silvibacterium sp. TaxID=1964179 RepID=UPI0039E615BD
MTALQGTVNPMANSRNDQGAVSSGTQLTGMTMYFAPSAAQKAALDALVQAQQTRGSAYYRQWLTPAEYAARFGMSAADLDKAKSWLEQQGFTVNRVTNSGNAIVFSGSVGQVEAAFNTSIHHYKVNNEIHTANASELQLPSALAGVVKSVRNISDFRPKANHIARPVAASAKVQSQFTSATSGDHYLAPGDVDVIYDINAAYNAGYTGTGQSIAIMGQSAVEASDIENFQSAAGLTEKDPTMVLVPDSGSSETVSGDEAESDIDLEWSGAIAKGATIYFVYVGSNQNYDVFDSIEYAVDTKIAPVISVSYGACETEISSTDLTTLEGIMEQGASQGQSIVVSSGDSGSTACYGTSGLTTTQQEALSVNYPASSAYATAIGGTEFSGDTSDASEYWESASGSDVVTSALKYIPEEAWNDDSSSDGLAATGGGVSTLITKPSWQTGVTGIPSGSYRYVPDVSLDASNEHDPYLYCSSDTEDTGITGSCSNGFRDSSDDYLTAAGGTSFGAPIFAAMLAITNQKLNSTGQGVVNSTLYTLAADSTTYASAFHDITTGNNECSAGTKYCDSTGESEYTTNTGYDEVTGLGTVDFYNLLTAWPTSVSSGASLTASTTTLTAASATPTSGATDAITITVSGSSATPTGTLTILVDGTTETSSLALSSGTATYSFSSTTSGDHTIVATYSGDSTYAASTGTVIVDVGGTTSSSSGSFTLTATNVTLTQGNSGTSTVTVTPSSYTGTVDLELSTTSTSLQDYGCYSVDDATVTNASTPVTSTLTVYTSETACASLTSTAKAHRHYFAKSGSTNSAASQPGSSPAGSRIPIGSTIAVAGLLCAGLARRRRRIASLLGCVLLLGAIGFVSGCGSSGSTTSSSTSTDVAKGTYTLTLTGTDSTTSSITSSTTFTLTVD